MSNKTECATLVARARRRIVGFCGCNYRPGQFLNSFFCSYCYSYYHSFLYFYCYKDHYYSIVIISIFHFIFLKFVSYIKYIANHKIQIGQWLASLSTNYEISVSIPIDTFVVYTNFD